MQNTKLREASLIFNVRVLPVKSAGAYTASMRPVFVLIRWVRTSKLILKNLCHLFTNFNESKCTEWYSGCT